MSSENGFSAVSAPRGLALRNWLRPNLALLLVAAAVGCESPAKAVREWGPADHGHPAVPDPARQPAGASNQAPEQGGEARAAQALWNVSCAGCHGRGGRGDGNAQPPGAQVPDMTLTAFHGARSDAQLAEVIRTGRALMPAFGDKLASQGIDALVRHIRTLAPRAEPVPAGQPPQPTQATPAQATPAQPTPPAVPPQKVPAPVAAPSP